jgi:hypothetical protein
MRWPVRRHRGEQGAVAVIVAFSMSALLVVAGLVVNLGLARTDKLTNKSYTDAAATAGIRGADALNNGQLHPFAGACTALAYLQANDRDLAVLSKSWKKGDGTTIADPCGSAPMLSALCVPNSPASWAWFSGTALGGRITVDIKTGYATPDSTPIFPGGPPFDAAGSGDPSNVAAGSCDQLAVIMHQTEHPGFGKGAKASDVVVATRSVGRETGGGDSPFGAAFVLMEQHACRVLQVTGTGKVSVHGNGVIPGSIHADSLGDGCSAGDKIFYIDQGSALIKANKAVTGSAGGIITTTALSGAAGAVPANAYSQVPWVCAEQSTGLCSAPTGAPMIGRAPADKRYSVGVRNAMSLAAAQYTKGSLPAPPPGSTLANVAYYVMPNCSPTLAQVTAVAAQTAIFFDCPGGVSISNSGAAFAFPNATDFVVNGPLSISSGASLSLPLAVRVYIKGVVGGAGVSATGSFIRINQGASYTPPPGSGCPARAAAAASQVVIGNGSFTVGAGSNAAMCNVTLLMADGSGFGGSTNLCPVPIPTVPPGTGQIPTNNTCGGYFNISGSSALDWNGPNRVSGQAQASDWANLEDLAFWSETSSANSTIGAGGSVQVTGVFFLPNAVFTISGAGIQNISANAQFISRRLIVGGSALIDLDPIATDVVTTALTPTFGLVR